MPVRYFVLFASLLFCGCGNGDRAAESRAKPASAPVKIVNFYASPTVVERGDTGLLCYGVENAASVRIEPDVAGVGPSPNRCVNISPAADTTYTLTAASEGGAQATATVEVKVVARSARPAPRSDTAAEPSGMIVTFIPTAGAVAPGQPLTLCYDVRGAESVSLDPPPPQPAEPGKKCVMVKPMKTTTYTLTARGGGKTETQKVTVRVR